MKSSAILCIALILVGLISSVSCSISHKHFTIIYKVTQGVFQIEEKIEYKKTDKLDKPKHIKGNVDHLRSSFSNEKLNIIRYFPIEAASLLVEGKCIEKVRLNESRNYRTAELTLSNLKNDCKEEKDYVVKFFYSLSSINYGEDLSKLNLSILSKEDENVKISLKFSIKQDDHKTISFDDKMILGFKDIIGNISVLDEGKLKYSVEGDYYFESQEIKLNHYVAKHIYLGFKPLSKLYHRQIESLIMSSKLSYSYFLVLFFYVFSVAMVGIFLFYSQVDNQKSKQEKALSDSNKLMNEDLQPEYN